MLFILELFCSLTLMSDVSSVLRSSGLRVPHEALPASIQPYIVEVYEEAIPALPTGPLRLPVSASLMPTLNVTFTGQAWVEIGSGTWMPREVLAGPQPVAYAATVQGEMQGFYVLFNAVGPLALFGVRRYWAGGGGPAPTLAETVRPSLASRACAYMSSLYAAPDFASRADLTVAFLVEARATAPAADLEAAAFLQRAVDLIEQARGCLRAEAIAQALGVSPATLRRRFAALGMPLKRFADITRFRHAHAFLHATPGATWADAVYEFGYADQPHFVRDYRRFSGGPPTRWAPAERALDLRMGIEGAYRHDEQNPS